MRIEDQIKRAIEQELTSRPSHAGSWDRVQRRFRRQQRVRMTAGVLGAAAAIVAGAIVVPRLGTGSVEPLPFASKPPVVNTKPNVSGTPTPATPKQVIGCVPNCRLIERRNFAAPDGTATGIAFDGERLWVMAGGHNAMTHTLTEVDPITGATGRRYTFENLIETQGTGVYGIAANASSIWISVSGNTNKIVKVDPSDGSIVRTYSSPSTLGPSDLSFDGTDLWLSSGTGEVFLIEESSGTIKKRLDTWPSNGRDHGVAVRPGELWVGGLFGGVAVQDPATGSVLDNVQDEQGRMIGKEWGPMTFAGGQLVLLDQFGITFYDVESQK